MLSPGIMHRESGLHEACRQAGPGSQSTLADNDTQAGVHEAPVCALLAPPTPRGSCGAEGAAPRAGASLKPSLQCTEEPGKAKTV